ncbi:MAG: hypothetical protein ACYCTI_02465 [Acidimicrobiales bacterium]
MQITRFGRPGLAEDFRVPGRGLHRQVVDAVFLETAAMVVEIVSPDDQTYEKLPFYAETGHSALLGVDGSTLEAAISWP